MVLIFANLTTAHAQDDRMASPLDLGRQEVPELLGVVVGPSFHKQLGSYQSGCPCTFDKGGANNFVFGLSYDKNLVTYGSNTKGGLWFGLRAMYETRNVAALFTEYENVRVRSLTTNELFTTPIQFQQQADIRFSMITLTPTITWYPFGRVFVQGGFQAGLVISSHFKQTKKLQQNTVTLPTGETAVVQFTQTDGNILTIEEGAVPQTNALQLGFTMAAGIDIPVGSNAKFRLTPMIQNVFPLTNLSNSGDGFRINAVQLLLGLKMNLK